MKRYSIELTSMQWGLIAVDLGKISGPSESTQNLQSLSKLILTHSTDQDFELPYNVKDVSDDAPV